MTNGEPVVIRAAMKPLSTLPTPLASVDMTTKAPLVKAHFERSDVCAVPAAATIGEAMVALTLTQALLEKFGGIQPGGVFQKRGLLSRRRMFARMVGRGEAGCPAIT